MNLSGADTPCPWHLARFHTKHKPMQVLLMGTCAALGLVTTAAFHSPSAERGREDEANSDMKDYCVNKNVVTQRLRGLKAWRSQSAVKRNYTLCSSAF